MWALTLSSLIFGLKFPNSSVTNSSVGTSKIKIALAGKGEVIIK
jgi:hypothetical protein